MKHIENINAKFFYFVVRNPALARLMKDKYLFESYGDEVVLNWAAKGDQFIGDAEEDIDYRSLIPNVYNEQFDFCNYLINLLETYQKCGLADEFAWREAFRYYSIDENVNYSEDPLYEERLTSEEIQDILVLLRDNHDEIQSNMHELCILEYSFNSDYESELTVMAHNGQEYVVDTFDEGDIDNWTGCDYFAQDFLVYEFELEHISEPILEEYYPEED